jgi:hypothetical protein
LVTNWRHRFERVHIRGNVVATILSNRAYLILCPRDRKEPNTTLFFSHEILLANVIAATKHRCCSSEDADVAKIDFMYFNPVVHCVVGFGGGSFLCAGVMMPREIRKVPFKVVNHLDVTLSRARRWGGTATDGVIILGIPKIRESSCVGLEIRGCPFGISTSRGG